MTKVEQKRKERLLPLNIPRYVRCYDNGGLDANGSCDRYTVVFSGKGYKVHGQYFHSILSMSETPFHPQGVCLHGEYSYLLDARNGWAPAIGRRNHLGLRIPFQDLPKDCQKIVIKDYKEIWNIS